MRYDAPVISNFYSVFKHTASASFLSFVLLACSSTPAPTTVPLESVTLQADGCVKISGPLESSVLYRCSDGNEDIFVTSLKDCSIPEKFTFQTTTRQLFVGLLGLKVISQEPVSLGETKALQTVVTGTLDAEPVIMSTFTFRRNKCVTDIVLWRSVASVNPGADSVSRFTNSSKQITASLFNEPLTVPDAATITSQR
jgi:hypothetical protein